MPLPDQKPIFGCLVNLDEGAVHDFPFFVNRRLGIDFKLLLLGSI